MDKLIAEILVIRVEFERRDRRTKTDNNIKNEHTSSLIPYIQNEITIKGEAKVYRKIRYFWSSARSLSALVDLRVVYKRMAVNKVIKMTFGNN